MDPREDGEEQEDGQSSGPEPSCVSFTSNKSKDFGVNFGRSSTRASKRSLQKQDGPDPEPSCLSFKSNKSKDFGVYFEGASTRASKRSLQEQDGPGPEPSCLSFKSNKSKDFGVNFEGGRSAKRPHLDHETDLDSTFTLLEDQMVVFVRAELKQMKKVLVSGHLDFPKSPSEDEEEASCLKLALYFLRRMKKDVLADRLLSDSQAVACQKRLKLRLGAASQRMFEGITKDGAPRRLDEVYTEQDVLEGEAGEVNGEHEVGQIERQHWKGPAPAVVRQDQLFAPAAAGRVRLVLTKGVAGIGKSVLTQKFTLDWAEGRAHRHLHFLFPFTFRELNVLKGRDFSLAALLHHFFPETRDVGVLQLQQHRLLFVFNGLDESRLPLDFQNPPLTDPLQAAPLDVLLTSLLAGHLLPAALVWITTRPAAAGLVPARLVGRVTEVRGFNDPQKDAYFRKSFGPQQAGRILAHMEASRTLHILCHIPAFCWITATVMKDELAGGGGGELPATLTEMYIHFLVLQTRLKKVKYEGGAPTEGLWSAQTKAMIGSLGRLAFRQLLTGNLIFYESDLEECGIDVRAASVYSGLFTQIFREQRGVSQGQVFSFIHLSFQEFLAALHVHLTFARWGVNRLLVEEEEEAELGVQRAETKVDVPAQIAFYQAAVDKALEDPDGRLDLFLRFLLGLSLQTNQMLLHGLAPQTGSTALTNQETALYIRRKMTDLLAPEKSINLFHCLNELRDRALEDEVRRFLEPGALAGRAPSPAQWAALVFILLSSEQRLARFDLKTFAASEDALLRLLPVVKASQAAVLSGCSLTERSCGSLSAVVGSPSSSLRVLDLSNNELRDAGLQRLCAGLQSPHCRLQVLRLSGCLITDEGCEFLASALTSRLQPRPLTELDLRFNPVTRAGVERLRGAVTALQWTHDALRVEPFGARWSTPGLKKYFCQLQLDADTVNQYVRLSADGRTATQVERALSYPEHPRRFDHYPQLLCRDGVRGRSYWEAECSGTAHVSLSYATVGRKGNRVEGKFGGSEQSWSLSCSHHGFSVSHNGTTTRIGSAPSSPAPPTSPAPPSLSRRVAVYVDCPAGTLSFYQVSSGALLHLYTFSTTFTQPPVPGFGFGFEFCRDSSLTLCSP